jgi:hypothetical protein
MSVRAVETHALAAADSDPTVPVRKNATTPSSAWRPTMPSASMTHWSMARTRRRTNAKYCALDKRRASADEASRSAIRIAAWRRSGCSTIRAWRSCLGSGVTWSEEPAFRMQSRSRWTSRVVPRCPPGPRSIAVEVDLELAPVEVRRKLSDDAIAQFVAHREYFVLDVVEIGDALDVVASELINGFGEREV